ncbi:MAG TPA: hypothetical protein EYP17_08890 [Candidatus Latescibacteria bacterium]|nr:hypothetical protein [Candidatus Latescibacterota bacterium]
MDEEMEVRTGQRPGGSGSCGSKGCWRLSEDVRHPYTLQTDRNRIEVYIPPDSGVSVYAKTHRGKVVSDLPLDIGVQGCTSVARGELNGGGPEVRLLTDRGDIHIIGDVKPQ